MAIFDRSKLQRDFTPGAYVTDGVILWRVLDLEERRHDALPLEDCHFPQAPAVWRTIDWLGQHKARLVRR